MKRIYCFLLLLLAWSSARADHISGGQIFYTVSDLNNGQFTYRVTVRLYMVCNSGRQFNNPAVMSIFSRSTGARVQDIIVNLGGEETLSMSNTNKCITNPPTVCYNVGNYYFDVTLPASSDGYYITCQVVYRINGISNLIFNYGNIGATYTAEIPGTSAVATGPKNNSARFVGDDMVVVCAFNSFSYSFGAVDSDGDQLRYSFCNAYQGGTGGFGSNSAPPQPPPYSSVPYSSNFSGTVPLGNAVKIDSRTGLITGVAPSPGIYVVTVCVEEVRNGVVIATQRKDLQINITSCSIASATIPPEYMLCRDTKVIELRNFSTSPLIQTVNWELMDNQGRTLFTSDQQAVSYEFQDTGIYKIKLVINRDGTCADSTSSIARVYPGFKPNFDFNGICLNKPTQFIQSSTSVYGQVNFWDWDFGDLSLNDFSDEPSPSYTYQLMGPKEVRMVAGNTVGCIDTIRKSLAIVDKPPLNLLFRDTLICRNDAVKFLAEAKGKYSWSPSNYMDNPESETPVVTPAVTTKYFVDINDNGCTNTDSVLVRVVDKVSLNIMSDTTICEGDAIRLRVISDAFAYSWQPAAQFDDPLSKMPLATTVTSTVYQVTATLGGCTASEQVRVQTVPYPKVNAGPDTLICFNSVAVLNGSTDASTFVWSPIASLSNFSSLQPSARPERTTSFILTAYDNRGCPKPSRDTVLVNVLPEIIAYAGKDTSVVVGQVLQLNAVGGSAYSWSPPLGLSSTNISDPQAVYTSETENVRYQVRVFNQAGCSDTAYVNVKVFASGPEIFVPNAFSPNGDGHNDFFRIIAAGIRSIEYVDVFNRWGQRVYRTANPESGWDGSIAGKPADSGTYVWFIKAVDYTGKPYLKKGTVTLLR